MSTANERVRSALQLLGADTPIKPARAETLNKTFKILQQMLALWNSQSINTSITMPTVIGDELGEPEQTQLAIDYQLAIKTASAIQKVATPDVRAQSRTLMQQLRNQFSPKPTTIYPGTMPIGTGNKTFPIGPTFYPDSENAITDEQGVPLTI
jgi:hypothetical protein